MKEIGTLAYAVARIHSIEKNMLSSDDFIRIAGSKDIDDGMKILSDFGYSKDLEKEKEIDDILEMQREKTFELLRTITGDEGYFDIFLLKADYHNLKVLFKEERLEANFNYLLKDGGTLKKEEIKNIFVEREFVKLNKIMQTAVNEVMDAMGKTNDPQLIDILLDKAYYKDVLDRVRETNSSFLREFVKLDIDTSNIKTFMRIKKLKLGIDFLKKVLIEGGELSKDFYIEKYEVDLSSIAEEFQYTRYGDLFPSGFNEDEDKLSNLEKRIDNMTIDMIKKYKYNAFGMEPIFAYIVGQDFEIKNIRIALSALKNDVPVEVMEERLRKAYV